MVQIDLRVLVIMTKIHAQAFLYDLLRDDPLSIVNRVRISKSNQTQSSFSYSWNRRSFPLQRSLHHLSNLVKEFYDLRSIQPYIECFTQQYLVCHSDFTNLHIPTLF